MRIPTNLAAALALAAALSASGCRTKDVRTVVITVPEMRCAQCKATIERALVSLNAGMGVQFDKGAGGKMGAPMIRFDLEKHTVTVTYDSMMMGVKNLEFAIAEAGYGVVAKPYDLPANPVARAALPPACRAHLDGAAAPAKSAGPATPAVPAAPPARAK